MQNMSRFTWQKLRRCDEGAAATEMAILLPVFLVVILGIIQMSLLIHAKMLVNYAAYSVARSGIVHNGDSGQMRRAAAAALTPLYADNGDVGGLTVGFLEALGRTVAPVSLGGIDIEILGPDGDRFSGDYDERFFPEIRPYGEINGEEDQEHLDENLLTVKVTIGYVLSIPLIDRILSPFAPIPHVVIGSTHTMRMQSDPTTIELEG